MTDLRTTAGSQLDDGGLDSRATTRRGLLRNMAIGGAALPSAGILLSACGDAETSSGATGSESTKGRDGIVIEYPQISGNDFFFRVIANGAEQAAKDFGVKLNHRSTPKFDVVEQRRLIEAAIASKPTGIITGAWDPDALGPPIKKATDAGIKVALIDAAFDAKGNLLTEELGALTYLGMDDFDAGVSAGESMRAAGVTNAVVVNHDPKQINIQNRSAGFKKGFGGKATEVIVPIDDPTAAQNRVSAAIQGGSFDGAMGLSADFGAAPAMKAIAELGKQSEVKVGSFDLTADIVGALEGGNLLFTIDAQQYLQGYLGVAYIALAAQYDFRPGADLMPTGPVVLTAEQDVGRLADFSKKGIR